MSKLVALSKQLIDRFEMTRGVIQTQIPGVRLGFFDKPVPRGPFLYEAGIMIVISGSKIAYLGDKAFEYNRHKYLALGLPLAMECETHASPEAPLFAILVAADPRIVRSVAGAMNIAEVAAAPPEVAVRGAPLAGTMLDAVERLLRTLCSDSDTAILGEAAVREIIYRALQGPAAAALHGLLTVEGHTSRIARVMEELHTRFADRLSVDDMARLAGMSPSVFHRAFRLVADDTPLQYLKKVRLTQASGLIVHGNYRVGTAAAAVGYESAAQFSRDFKSHFGIPPADARKLGYAFSLSDAPVSGADA